MPEFQYVGVDKYGKKTEGKIEAPNEGELRMLLRGRGIRPLRLGKVGLLQQDLGSIFKLGGGQSVNVGNLALFTRQLHVLVASGIPLVQSLDILGDQSSDPALKRIIPVIKEKVSQGSFLWEAFNGYPRAFPKIYIALIRAGEASGAMEAILERLSKYLENTNKLQKMVKSAMMYPMIVGSIGVGVILVMLTFVIPRFESMLKTTGGELPAPTQMVISVSHFLGNNFFLIVLGVGVAVFMLRRFAATPEGRAIFDRFQYTMPLFGGLVQKSSVARFCRTLATLIVSGVNLIDAIEICRSAAGNVVIENAVIILRREVETGKSIGAVLGKLPAFPKMASQMVAVGESTGSLEKMLERVADFYESDVEILVSGLSRLVEPIMLVAMGGVIAAIMISMYLPIFKMAGNM